MTKGHEENTPGNYLACHLVPRIGKVPGQTKISDFQLAIGSDKQIVGLQVLDRP